MKLKCSLSVISYLFLRLTGFISLIWAADSSSASLVNSAKKTTPMELVLNWKAESQFGGFYYLAQEWSKSYPEQPIQLKPGGSQTPTASLVLNKKVPLAIVSGDELVLAHERGHSELVALFATFQWNPQMIMVHKKLKISSLEALFAQKHLTLQWQQGLPYAQYLRFRYPQFHIKTSPYLGGVSLFLKDPQLAQQGFVTSEPLLLPPSVEVDVFPIRQAGFDPYMTVVATHREWIQQNPQRAQDLVLALQRSWARYLEAPLEAHKKMQQENPFLSSDFLKQSDALQKPYIKGELNHLPLGTMTVERWEQLIQALKKAQLVRKKIKAQDLFLPL